MSQALYREWRPLTWSEVVGQEHVVRTLQNAVKAERLSHAYLFSGPRGTGKTSTARILAKAVNCLTESLAERPDNECSACVAVNEARYLDLIEIDAASNTSVDDVRDLRERINFSPNEGRFKVYIVDEVHMLSTAAFNALLKTLEEPPQHAIFVLATTEVHKVPATVLSRCQRHEFRRIPVDEIDRYLEAKIEEADYQVEAEARRLIARQATGSLRDATSLLDQLVSMGEAVTLEQAQEVLGTAVDEAVGDLVQAMADEDIGKGLEIINHAIDGGIDPRQFARQIVEWLRTLLLLTIDEQAGIKSEAMLQQAESMRSETILTAMHAYSQATRSERTAWQPGLALELAFMDTVHKSSVPVESKESPSVGDPGKPATAPEVDRLNTHAETETTQDADRQSAQPETEALQEVDHLNTQSEAETAPEVDHQDTQPEIEAAPEVGGEATQEAVDSADDRKQAQSGSTFQQVLEAWPELLAAAYGRDPQTQALLNSCKPLGVDENALVLGFQSDLLREKMEKGHNQQIVSEALGEVLEAELDVRCVLLKDWGGDQSSSPTPPLPEGGMVAAALRDLGAEVVDYGPDVESESQQESSSEEMSNEEER